MLLATTTGIVAPKVVSQPTPSFDIEGGALIWMIVSLILAIVGGIVIYFLFSSKKNKGEFKGFLAWLHSFLRFDKMLIEALIKISYIATALFITLSSFSVISVSFLGFLIYLVFGNILARICYEAVIITIQIWKNTTEIKEDISKKKDK